MSVDSTHGDAFVTALVPVRAAERAMKVRVSRFEHRHSGRRVLRSLDVPQLPSEFADQVELVVGLGDFFDFKHERRASVAADNAAAAARATATGSSPLTRSTGEPLILATSDA